jgi:prophage antirepressor-like protein
MENTSIQTLVNDSLGLDLTVITNNETGESYFFASEIAKKLSHSNASAMLKSAGVDDEDRSKIKNPKSGQKSVIVNQCGLWACLVNSQKKEARPFKKWLSKSLLPSIMKHGVYDSLISSQKTEIGRGIAEAMTYNPRFQDRRERILDKRTRQSEVRKLDSFNQDDLRGVGRINDERRKYIINNFGEK